MNPSYLLILATLGIGAFKGINMGSMDKIDPKLIGIVENVTQCVKITNENTAVSLLEFFKSIEDKPNYDAFIKNMSQMVYSDFNRKFYVEMTKEEFFDCLGSFFEQFSYWHNLPFLNLSPNTMKGINLNGLKKKTAANNPIMIMRDEIRKKGYNYLPAYYGLKNFSLNEDLLPYQILFAKKFINGQFKSNFQKNKYKKWIKMPVPYMGIRSVVQKKAEKADDIMSKFTPTYDYVFDDSFEIVISSIRNKAESSQAKSYFTNLMATDYSHLNLPNFMPPKEMITLFWSYIGIVNVKPNVTNLWRMI